MSIILDCDLMRYRNTGLYHYCLNIGMYVNAILKQQEESLIKLYVPPAEADSFGDPVNTIVEKPWHRFVKPFLWDCRIWHAPFQSGRMLPDRKKHKSCKVLLTIHDLNALHEGQPKDVQVRSISHTQDLINKSDALVCISEFTKSDVLKHCDVGNKPMYVIYNGTHKMHDPVCSDGSVRPARPFLFGMGDLNRKKNYHVLLPVLHQNPELELVISGRLAEPDYIAAIKADAEKMGVADRLHVTGPIPEQDKSWYLCNCTAFVHPSLAEGFGAPVVEAMSFGKPLFLSNRTSLPEIGGDVAFYFSSFDPLHMHETFRDGMLQYKEKDMRDRIVQRGKEFDWNRSAQQYIEVYKTLY